MQRTLSGTVSCRVISFSMPLTLEQYARYLDSRDLAWSAPPEIKKPRARPHLPTLPGIKAVLWNVYGTLLGVSGGELLLEHPDEMIMSVALDKTVTEFKMWGAMSRKPGQPGDYLKQLYARALLEQRSVTTGAERHPEMASE